LKIRMKRMMYKDKPWLVNIAFRSEYQRDHLTVILSGEDDSDLTLNMTVQEYNAIEYSWFEEKGDAPHGSVVKGEEVKIDREDRNLLNRITALALALNAVTKELESKNQELRNLREEMQKGALH